MTPPDCFLLCALAALVGFCAGWIARPTTLPVAPVQETPPLPPDPADWWKEKRGGGAA